jgi:hypothetical protein
VAIRAAQRLAPGATDLAKGAAALVGAVGFQPLLRFVRSGRFAIAAGTLASTRLRWCGFALLDMIHSPSVGGSSG